MHFAFSVLFSPPCASLPALLVALIPSPPLQPPHPPSHPRANLAEEPSFRVRLSVCPCVRLCPQGKFLAGLEPSIADVLFTVLLARLHFAPELAVRHPSRRVFSARAACGFGFLCGPCLCVLPAARSSAIRPSVTTPPNTPHTQKAHA